MLSGKMSKKEGLSGALSGGSAMHGKMSLPPARAANYEELKNKPSINNVELQGNKELDEIGIAEADAMDILNMF